MARRSLARGGSLLPVGMTRIEGEFDRGDTVCITDSAQRELARGIANYSADDLKRIARHQSDEIETLLGYHYGDEVIHRNDMVIL